VVDSDPLMSSLVQVFLYDDSTGGASSCSGTLIANDLVVTAAHCLVSDTEGLVEKKNDGRFGSPEVLYFVYRGNLNKGWNGNLKFVDALGEGPGWLKVKSAHIPPNFGHTEGSHFDADIGLLQVQPDPSRPTQAYPALSDASLLLDRADVRVVGAGPKTADESKNQVHIFSTIRGFLVGGLDHHHSIHDLRYVNEQGISSDCTTEYVGLHHGDSGGPALITVKGKEYVWGVDSQGATYTVIALQKKWIEDVARIIGSSFQF
jgi:hypothetical protein